MRKIIFLIILFKVALFAKLDLTEAEQRWLDAHPVIIAGIDSNYAPFEFVDEKGQFAGMAIDYLKEIEKILGVKIEIKTAKSWENVTNMAKSGSVDFLSCLAKTQERAKYLNFTKPYLSFPTAIVTNKTAGYVNGLKELNGKTVAVIDQYMANQRLEEHYDNIYLVKTQNLSQGLELVASGKTFAYVDNLSQLIYALQKGTFGNLAISGVADYKFDYAMASITKEPILRDILQKALDNIPSEIRQSIHCKWFPPAYQQATDYKLVWQVVCVGMLVLGVFGCWLYLLKKEIKKRISIEQDLNRNREWLNCSLNSAEIGAWDLDIISQTISGNSVFSGILGLEDSEILLSMERFKSDFIYKDDLAKFLSHLERCFEAKGEFCALEFRVVSSDKNTKKVEITSKVFKYDLYQNPIRMMGFMKEI
ncbi:transporter substrate-binding domain-containing protein [Campylobacter geochelonis]|uniref:Hook assembly protein n=1 Tax=Campylobacter geochelonis TaxID=1780362 RepID=A0A128EHX3_9BACT|nr:transporter substrate-binding domain-containing protein [Campylobacter geochelonis]QKF71392.1 BvgS-like domain-containing signal transduction sensor histidine kinase [Campylobacter geochelonis]CZE47722.1 hook assembly protein [Campylobacter geochelonis]CZE48434.1 hook assembly protein [Campylobacter geochelonis]